MTSSTAHLTAADYDEIGRELDAIRAEVQESLGAADAAYIHKVIKLQRSLEVGGRVILFASFLPPAWIAGTVALSAAKILENMEIGHNVLHGQWDWMRDPKIHSTTWEWDTASPSDQWKHGHNFLHHTYTNVLGKDRDIGYTILRVSPEQPWNPVYLAQPVYNALLAMFFEYGIALYDVDIPKAFEGGAAGRAEAWGQLKAIGRKVRKQVLKDYVAFPLLAGPNFLPVLLANFTANVTRNVWSHTIIFCGHFPDGTEVFTEDRLEGETRGQWYVRQLLGSANISGSPLFHLMSGNLSHQIEHHLFPDLPSNRYATIAPHVRALFEKYDLPYNSAPLPHQIGSTWRKILRLSLPGGSPSTTPSRPRPRPLTPG
jgi:NADPH-dependent stearoyl-CoA 9-desaturase